ncbi:glutathione S-transferase C-terminal domain-containing protein [Chelatococcus sp. SYSU_G07232]|uniref:Glutathione S-transferase C-terminal domain-containing protein n=1 Tax=Chelatococcus albus TaxID=3047466 RepID=A0ABT7AIP0_9HYPH|nr:glutathione S-transferase C-terminal domain-containing protein [Chelatococcus sp. SYSU_G07232]MDJ1158950.1 glutathione S-transferase C-terminal domain-containing protein [Chelatococcus sp. SYSU_G07232]
MIQLTGIGPMFGQYVHFARYHKGIDYAEARYRSEAIRLMNLLGERLAAVPWLGGADYSVADVATYPWLRNAGPMGLPTEGRPKLARWLDAVAERPATVRFLEKIRDIASATDAARSVATPDGLDRMFGRGRYARVA